MSIFIAPADRERYLHPDHDRMLHPKHVASMFGVNAKTIRRWAVAGYLPYVTTFGGHRRYSEKAVQELLARRSLAAEEPQL